VYISDSINGWKLAQLVAGNNTGDNNNANIKWKKGLDQFGGRTKYFVMVKIRVNNSTYPTWTFLNSLKVTFGTKIGNTPLVVNGPMVNEPFTDSSFAAGHLTSANGYSLGSNT
jgi:hypothetical protein